MSELSLATVGVASNTTQHLPGQTEREHACLALVLHARPSVPLAPGQTEKYQFPKAGSGSSEPLASSLGIFKCTLFISANLELSGDRARCGGIGADELDALFDR